MPNAFFFRRAATVFYPSYRISYSDDTDWLWETEDGSSTYTVRAAASDQAARFREVLPTYQEGRYFILKRTKSSQEVMVVAEIELEFAETRER